MLVACLTATLAVSGGGGYAVAAEPTAGTWTGGAALGFLVNNAADTSAVAVNANVERFVNPSFSVGPLLQLAFATDLAQVGVSGQVKYWMDLSRGLKLTARGGLGFVHTDFAGGDTSFLIPLGVGVDYALNRNVSATATFLLNLTHLGTTPGNRAHVMPSLTFGLRF